jgi:hypothetical protein
MQVLQDISASVKRLERHLVPKPEGKEETTPINSEIATTHRGMDLPPQPETLYYRVTLEYAKKCKNPVFN